MRKGLNAVKEAREWIGTPVVWEASLKGKGCDCRGLVAGVARELGWPEGSAFEASVGAYARNIDEAKLTAGLDRLLRRVRPDMMHKGDVLGFTIKGKMQHLGIFAGEGRMVHAYMTPPSKVVEVPLGVYWTNRLAGVWRWKSLRPTAPLLEGKTNGR